MWARKLVSCFRMASIMLDIRSTSLVHWPIKFPAFQHATLIIEMPGGPRDKIKLPVSIKVLFI